MNVQEIKAILKDLIDKIDDFKVLHRVWAILDRFYSTH